MAQEDAVPEQSGYAESQPKDKQGSQRNPDADAPLQPQNAPDAKPKPSS